MIKILFVCHGNICRSPMAEFMFKDMVKKRNIADDFYIESKAVSQEEIGNDIYPPAKRKLREKGIEFSSHQASQIRREDFSNYDYILVMDSSNLRYLAYLGMEKYYKNDQVFKLMHFASSNKDVADPWYTGDFERTYLDILEGLKGFLQFLGY